MKVISRQVRIIIHNFQDSRSSLLVDILNPFKEKEKFESFVFEFVEMVISWTIYRAIQMQIIVFQASVHGALNQLEHDGIVKRHSGPAISPHREKFPRWLSQLA